jgi:putative tricarboxylic transport membrane protein
MGLAGLLLSLAYGTNGVMTLPMGKMAAPGAAVFPLAVAVAVAVISLMIVLEQVWGKPEEGDGPLDLPRGADLRRLLSTGVSVVAYIVLAKYLGSLVANAVLCLWLVRLVEPTLSWWRLILVALGLAVSTYVLFNMILGVPLPEGIFE